MSMTARTLAGALILATSLAAAPAVAQSAGPAPAGSPAPQVVDSILPPEVELARFRSTIPGPPPRSLAGPASRDELVRRFVRALERSDTTALVQLALSKADFGYLFFPGSTYSRHPYRQKPALVWFRMTATSEKGLGRLLRRDAGKPLGYLGHRCAPKPELQTKGRIWKDCLVIVSRGGGQVERKLFGSILEQNGRFKFLTYATEY